MDARSSLRASEPAFAGRFLRNTAGGRLYRNPTLPKRAVVIESPHVPEKNQQRALNMRPLLVWRGLLYAVRHSAKSGVDR